MIDENEVELEVQEQIEIAVVRRELEILKEIKNALAAGEIDLWVEYYEPKSLEDWDAFREKHGDNFPDRWL